MWASRLLLLRQSLWCLAPNTLLATAIAFRYLDGARPESWIDTLFLLLAPVGHFGTAALLLWLLLAVPAILLWPRRWILLAWQLGNALCLTLLLCDTVVYRIVHYHIDPFFLLMLRDGGATGFFDISPLSRALILLALIGSFLLQQAMLRFLEPRGGAWIIALVLGSLAGAHGMHAWASAAGYRSLTQFAELLPAFHGLTANRWLSQHGYTVAPRPSLKVGQGRLHYPRAPLRCAPASRPDILLVVVESWRFEALRREVMPTTAAFAETALQFRQHHSGGNTTVPGLASMVYGINATYWESITGADGAGGPVILSSLQPEGYRYFAAGSYDTLGRLRFDHYLFGALPPGRVRLNLHRSYLPDSDRANVEDFQRFLAENGENPYFGLIFFDSTHHRYAYPSDYQPRFLPTRSAEISSFSADTDPTPYYNQYLNAAGFVDSQIARLLELLAPRMDHTILILTGDHGESFNDRRQNDWGHGVDFGEMQTHVPLLIHWPGRSPEIYDHTSIHEDLSPTLLKEALHCENLVGDYSNGQSLFDPTERISRVVAGYVGYGVVTRRDILSQLGGIVRITDRDLSPKGSVDDPEGLKSALEGTWRFYSDASDLDPPR